MEKNNKIGVLKYIAGTGAKGVKFEDQPETWYNPSSDEAKEMVKEDFKGKTVEITLVPGKKTEFSSMVLLDVKDEPEITTAEEKIEEKVSPAPLPKEETTDPVPDYEEQKIIYNAPGDHYTQADYKEMESTKLETAKKGSMGLTYASWSEAWGTLKRLHPTANFKVHEKNGLPVFFNAEMPSMGAFVKVTVTVKGLNHTVHLPVMDHSNKSIPTGTMTTFDINKNIQRALAKGVALHGIGLYVFKGEDLPK